MIILILGIIFVVIWIYSEMEEDRKLRDWNDILHDTPKGKDIVRKAVDNAYRKHEKTT